MRTLLIEIGTEEIPARFIEPAKEGFSKLLADTFTFHRITFGNITTEGTPRRLAMLVTEVAEKQNESAILKFGPPWNKAFDETGNPTKAALGFAKSQGVSPEELRREIKDGVEFLAVEKREIGSPVIEVLPVILPDIIAKIPFLKRMHWGAESFEYARPIQWIAALYGNEPVRFSVADVTSGNTTYGHRFLSEGPLEITDPDRYIDVLRRNSIIIDERERMEVILKGIAQIEAATGGKAIGDQALIKEILYITEFPYPLQGAYESDFLAIPKEVLVNVMKSHQRYIPIENTDGGLMPYFIFFANTTPKDSAVVIKGNEKVLRARLADARFFFEEDLKVPLMDLTPRLGSIVYHVKLGTLKQKTDRVLEVARSVAAMAGITDTATVAKAAAMAKADLVTHMVGEFPELQGTMGRIYALSHGEDPEVARAIEEHYLPTGGTSALPETLTGTIVGIADKIDSVTSFFSVGIAPTGNLDPYALRRQALGVIRTVIDKKMRLPLDNLIEASYAAGAAIQSRLSLDETKNSVKEFIATRFRYLMLEENHNLDFVEAVLPFVAQDIYDGYLRLVALETQKSLEDFQRLMVGFKRVFNITKQLSGTMKVNPGLFALAEEERLFTLYSEKNGQYYSALNERRYEEALAMLVSFKETVDNFFDKVFVMDKDEAVKTNRLALLHTIKEMFLGFGDFSKIRIE